MEIIKYLQTFSNPTLDFIFQLITAMGEHLFYTIILSIIFWCVNKKFAYKLGLTLFFSLSLNSCLKEIFNVPRPIGVEGITSKRVSTATGMSFPSGHTQGASTFWTCLSVHLKKTWFWIFSVILILSIGVSRLYLGVHWPSDVIGGLILGILCVVFINYIFKLDSDLPFIIIGMIMMVGLLFLHSSNYVKATATYVSFLCGMLIEKKYINFTEKNSLPLQILKVITGLAALLAIKAGVKALLPAGNPADFIRYFSIIFWAIVIHPLMFEKLLPAKKSAQKNV